MAKSLADSIALPPSPYCPSCGLGKHTSFLERVEQLIAEQEVVREGLWHEGPALVDALMRRWSLREAGRRSGLSPTYLSQVLHSNVIISTSAFVRLAQLELRTRPCNGS